MFPFIFVEVGNKVLYPALIMELDCFIRSGLSVRDKVTFFKRKADSIEFEMVLYLKSVSGK